MFTKILVVAVALTAVAAQHHHQLHHHGHDHGHAVSSQSIVLHHNEHKHAPAHHEEHYHGNHEEHHGHHEQHHHEHHGYEEHLGHHEHHSHASSAQSIHLYNDGHATKHIEYYGHPKYEFAYEVKDPHTHDFKQQHEHRNGDVVKGEYSLHQPDGSVRHVLYHADKKNGFSANVKYEQHHHH